jgi:RNA polymerase sigma-70 factor (ECF subfamily)
MERETIFDPLVLMALARQGDAAALGNLLEVYRRYVQIMATIHLDRTIQHRVSPSDVVQETFVQAFLNFMQFRGSTEAEFLQWIRRIAASRMAMASRQFHTQRQDVRQEERLNEAMEGWSDRAAIWMSDKGSSPSQQVIKREQAVVLADALAELPPDYREVILLRHFQNLQFSAIAAQMERSEDSVKNIWVRAIKRLRELIVDFST